MDPTKGDKVYNKNRNKVCKVFVGTGIVLVTLGVGLGIGIYYGLKDHCESDGSCLGHYRSNSTLGEFNEYAISTDSQPCASIGKQILKDGGNAIDSMISVLLCMGVTIPESMGLGGGALILIYKANTKKSYAINAREMAPIAAHKDMYKDNHKASVDGPLAIGVPGELHGYRKMYLDHGSGHIKWSTLFAGAIQLCEDGFEVSEHLATCLRQKEDFILKHPSLKDVYFNPSTQSIYKQGEKMKQPTLGKTLRQLAESQDPIKLYYEELSKIIVQDIHDSVTDWNNTKPIITVDDFKNYQLINDEAVVTTLNVTNNHDNLVLHSFPLPGSGDLLGFIMNVMQRYPDLYPNAGQSLYDSSIFYHRLVETYKYAFAKRAHLEDSKTPKVLDVLSKLKSDEFARKVRYAIDDLKTFESSSGHYDDDLTVYMSEDHGTAHASVVDKEGNAVAVTTTVNSYFGSKVMSPKTGILLNNQMDDFNTGAVNDFGIPSSDSNWVVAGRRPLSSMCPTIFSDNNGLRLVIGGSGGPKITTTVASVSMRNLWFNEDIKQAIDGQRLHHQLFKDEIIYEKNFPKPLLTRLAKKGHKVTQLADGDRGAVIMAISKQNGKLYANSDYRKGGAVDGL